MVLPGRPAASSETSAPWWPPQVIQVQAGSECSHLAAVAFGSSRCWRKVGRSSSEFTGERAATASASRCCHCGPWVGSSGKLYCISIMALVTDAFCRRPDLADTRHSSEHEVLQLFVCRPGLWCWLMARLFGGKACNQLDQSGSFLRHLPYQG